MVLSGQSMKSAPAAASLRAEDSIKIVDQDAPLPSGRRTDYPPELELIVMRALRRDPAERFQTAQELQAFDVLRQRMRVQRHLGVRVRAQQGLAFGAYGAIAQRRALGRAGDDTDMLRHVGAPSWMYRFPRDRVYSILRARRHCLRVRCPCRACSACQFASALVRTIPSVFRYRGCPRSCRSRISAD